MKIYIVTAYRWGSNEEHSYIVGAYSSEPKAAKAAHNEGQHRGGKYTCEVVEVTLDRDSFRRVRAIPFLKVRKAFRRFLSKHGYDDR